MGIQVGGKIYSNENEFNLPDSSGTLATQEYVAEHASPGGSLPDQTGNSGKFLTTDGTDASWDTVAGGTTNFDQALAAGATLTEDRTIDAGGFAFTINNGVTIPEIGGVDGILFNLGGFIRLKSPDGTGWNITVDDAGTLVVTEDI